MYSSSALIYLAEAMLAISITFLLLKKRSACDCLTVSRALLPDGVLF